MNALELINIGSERLKKKSIPSHCLDSEIILSRILNKSREEILINLNQKITNNKALKFLDYINRRCGSEPLAYMFNEKEFWSTSFEVDRNTLIPRPETELMIETLVRMNKEKKIFILDIGTGSGCIIISLLKELIHSKGVALDISGKALKIAKKNAKRNKIHNLKFIKKSFEALYNKKFDLIVSNPPYIKSADIKNLNDDIKLFEPKIALDGGNDGLDVIKKLIYKAREILKINGVLALEIGNEQYRKVSKILFKNYYRIEHNIKDYKENTRIIIARLINK